MKFIVTILTFLLVIFMACSASDDSPPDNPNNGDRVDLLVTITVDNSTPDEGEIITYTIRVSNKGPVNATSVSVSSILPAGVTATGAYVASKGNYSSSTWTIGTINNGSNVSLTIEAMVDAGEAGNSITSIITSVSFDQTDSNITPDDLSVDILVNDLNQNGSKFYYGADLSYINEMEDCGAVYTDVNNVTKDPYTIFKEAGSNLVRLRLWHNPTWTNYSNFEDVKKSIQRAKNEEMEVLLDFHYSDNWADPIKQEIPAAWLDEINNTEALGDLLYNYTYNTLHDLADANLLPDIVQVGNEINPMILQQGDLVWPIDWTRNSSLINKGIKAVRDISQERNKEVDVMLHIAQPENGLWWFEQATQNGVTDFDWIGLSYYPVWSDFTLDNLSTPLSILKNTYNKRLMIVETAYPFTMENADSANNILGNDALVSGFPATQQGQLDYLNILKEVIETSGGEGLIYWEPAWVSTDCFTQWAQGSHWDNSTLFDHNYKATLGMDFYNGSINK